MYILPLSESAASRLTEAVVLYQSRRSDHVLYSSLHKQTQQLLYELPRFLHLLDEEDCCEFLFFCYEAIPYYLHTYKEGRLSYVGYLCQVVRKRSRYFIAQQQVKRKKELLLAESDYYHQQLDEMPESTAESATYCSFKTFPLKDISELPALFNQILDHPTHQSMDITGPLLKLKKALANSVNRRRFLLTLTLSPNLAGEYLLEELASLLEVDAKLLSEYLNTANSVLSQKQACKKEFEAVSHRHFRRLLEIEAELLREEDADKRLKLEELRTWTQRVYTTKIQQIRKLELNLSHSELGRLLGIPKGTIDSSVYYMKRLLTRCMDEPTDNEYL